MENVSNETIKFKLGRSIAQIIPFYRHIREKEVFSNKILIIMAGVAIAKVAVFLLWPM